MENEKQSTVEFEGAPEKTPESRKPQTGLAMLLPVALLGGALWLGARGPEPIGTASNVLPMPKRKPARIVQAPSAMEDSEIARLEIFMPNDDGKLDRKSVEAPGIILSRKTIAQNRTALQEKLVTAALKKLLKDAADFFPAGTALAGPVSLEGGHVNVNLNRAYAQNAESWSSAETTTRVMSIVNTAVATKEPISGSESSAVRILIEGKPVDSLGPIDASEPIEGEPVALKVAVSKT